MRAISRSKSAVWAIDSSRRPTPRVDEVFASTLFKSFLSQRPTMSSSARLDLYECEKSLLGDLAKPGRQHGTDVPSLREDGRILLLVRLEDAPEPRKPARDVVELTGFGRGTKDAAVVAEEEERVPLEQRVPERAWLQSARGPERGGRRRGALGFVSEGVDNETGISQLRVFTSASRLVRKAASRRTRSPLSARSFMQY